MRFKLATLIFLYGLITKAQSLKVYELVIHEQPLQQNVGFISLSDNYRLSEHPDSLAIPDVALIGKERAQYFRLKGEFRNRFLSQLKISQNDKIFIHEYSTNTHVSIPITALQVVASLSPYVTEDEWPYTQYDYMIGFEVDMKYIKKFSSHFTSSLAYVGNDNPFVNGKLKPIKWKEISAKDSSHVVFSSKIDSNLQEYGYTDYHNGSLRSYRTDIYQYFVQDILNKANEVFARSLLIIDSNNKVLVEKVYFDSEGASLAPLNYTDSGGYLSQWTGQLFNNKPDVIFGFEYQSFGCPAITFIGKEEDLIINCDNRH